MTTLHDPAVLAALEKLWLAWSRAYSTTLRESKEVRAAFQASRDARHRFVAAFLDDPEVTEEDTVHLWSEVTLLSDTADLEWLLERIAVAQASRRPMWARVIGSLSRQAEVAAPCWDRLLARIDELPEMTAQFAWLRAWSLDEPCAVEARALWQKQQTWRRRHEERASERPRQRREEIQQHLAALAAGSTDAWFPLWHGLLFGDADATSSHGSDVAEFPAWKKLSASEQAIARRGARDWLVAQAAEAAGYLPTMLGAQAGRAALSLHMDAVETDDALRAALAGPWLPALVGGPSFEPGDARERQFALLYRLHPDGCIDAMLAEARRQLEERLSPTAFQLARLCWDAHISRRVVAFLETLARPADILAGIDALASLDASAASACAMQNLGRYSQSDAGSCRLGLRHALLAALLHAPSPTLPSAIALMEGDAVLQRAVWIAVLDRIDWGHRRTLSALDEPALGSLYEEILRSLPVEEDPPWSGGEITPEMSARRIRDTIPGIIAGRASEAACRELDRLARALPARSTALRWSYREAVLNVRRHRWQPPDPRAVTQLLREPRARLLHCDLDLQELILESLAELQHHLTGQMLPAAEELWHWTGAGNVRTAFRPKDEEFLSDYLARWLRDRIGPTAGIVVGREVQPKRGLRTDITVQAAPVGSDGRYDTLTVVIEVKGCWHSEVRTALRSQLVADYLAPHGLRCGIYLVGWFVCPRALSVTNHLASPTLAEARAEVARFALPEAIGATGFHIAIRVLDCTI